jgi:amino acid transporter
MSATQRPLISGLKRLLLGRPIATSQEHQERLSLSLGLPILASDALSSSAYATEAIVSILILGGTALLGLQPWITLSICLLYFIVVVSYRQTVNAYPSGGGSYIVASDNLGEKPAVIAGAALLIDYVLTVAVSIAAGVAAIVSAFPELHDWLIPMNIGAIAFIAWMNLRGVRESGRLFAFPTYGFLAGMFAMIVVGFFRNVGQPLPDQTVVADPGLIGSEMTFPLIFLLLRAFSAGCVALTGVEAISNGVPAFKAPESRNAALSLGWLAALMITMFIGTGYLIQYLPQLSLYTAAYPEHRTVVSQIAAHVFGHASFGFYYIQFATAAILILAANTAFADFPRLASILARDGYLPRPMARLGDKLVFQNGIVLLAILAMGLVWYFKGQLDLLLPLYAVGVFTAFTLSQSGMIAHWRKLKEKGWQRRLLVNAVGAIATGAVALVILTTKFAEGAWIVLVLMAITAAGLIAVNRRYRSMTAQLAPPEISKPEAVSHTTIILVPRIHKGILAAIDYAMSLRGDIRAVHIRVDPRSSDVIAGQWDRYAPNVPLVVLDSPYRSLIEPTLEYIDQMVAEDPSSVVTVVIAEAVSTRWYQRLLHENVAQQLKRALGSRRNVVVSNVRYFLD